MTNCSLLSKKTWATLQPRDNILMTVIGYLIPDRIKIFQIYKPNFFKILPEQFNVPLAFLPVFVQ